MKFTGTKVLLLTFLFFSFFFCIAQNKDSLINIYLNVNNDTLKCKALYELTEKTSDLKVSEHYNTLMFNFTYEKIKTPSINQNKYLNRFFQIYHSIALNNKGYLENSRGNIKSAIEYYSEAIKIQQEIDDKSSLSSSYNNLAFVYRNFGDLDKALEYFLLSLKLRESLQFKDAIALTSCNIGNIYRLKKDSINSLKYLNKAYKLTKDLKEKFYEMLVLGNLAFLNLDYKNYDSALSLFNKSYDLAIILNDNEKQIQYLRGLATVYYHKNDLSKARVLAEQSYAIALKVGYPKPIFDITETLSLIYSKLGNWKDAYNMQLIHRKMNDSINNESVKKELIKNSIREVFIQKAINDSLKSAEEKKILDIKIEQQKTKTYYLTVGLLFLLVFLIYVAYTLNKKHKTNIILQQQKNEIETQRNEIIDQNIQLNRKNALIQDGINYAKHLQQGILPNKKHFKEYFNKVSLLFLPKDVVSGDFYWCKKTTNSFYFSVIDCTGHGVPGAMLSIHGYSILEQILKDNVDFSPAEILNKLSLRFFEQLKEKNDSINDGMELILCKYCPQNKTIEFSGSGHSLYHISNHTLTQYKSEQQIVGRSESEFFTNQTIFLQQNDSIILFSDGFVDQKGEKTGKKYMKSNFRNLLLNIVDKPEPEQENTLEKEFYHWKGKEEQRDDVCVLYLTL